MKVPPPRPGRHRATAVGLVSAALLVEERTEIDQALERANQLSKEAQDMHAKVTRESARGSALADRRLRVLVVVVALAIVFTLGGLVASRFMV